MKTVLCYGDSNTYGYDPANGQRYPRDIRWTGRLQRLLGDDYHVIEEGCNGRTTVFDDPKEEGRNGLDYLRPCLSSHRPLDIVILMLGTNDLKVFFKATADQIAEGAGRLVEVIRDHLMHKQGYIPEIILISPPRIGEDIINSPFKDEFREDAVIRSGKFPELYQSVAQRYGCVFFDAAEYVEPSPLDSLHLSASSHNDLAKGLCSVIKADETYNL